MESGRERPMIYGGEQDREVWDRSPCTALWGVICVTVKAQWLMDDQWATVVVLPVQNFIVGFHRYMYVDATFDCSRHVDVSAILDRSTSFPRFHNIVHPLFRYFYLFIMHKKYSRSFITLRLNHWCHINYFNSILTTFLGLEHGSYVAVYGGSESSGVSSRIS